MSRAVFVATVRERLTSVVTLILVATILAVPLIVSGGSLGSPGSLIGSLGLVLVLGAGCIGREVSAGSLGLVFCRPIRRSEYVLTQWIAISVLALGFGLLQVGMLGAACLHAHVSISLASAAQNVLERVLVSFGVSSVVVLFSTFCPRSTDVVLWCVAALIGQLAGESEVAAIKWSGKELYRQLAPEVTYLHVFQSRPIVWSAVFGYGATVCLALALACWVLGRKELSYGT